MPRISELPALAQATSGDIIPIVDDAGNITKKVTADKVVPDGSVVTSQLANNAVTTAKIGNGQVTAGKINFTTSVDANGWTVRDFGNFKTYTKRIVFGASSTTAVDETRQAWSVLPVGLTGPVLKEEILATNTTQNLGAMLGFTATPELVSGERRVYLTWTNLSNATRTFTDVSGNVQITR